MYATLTLTLARALSFSTRRGQANGATVGVDSLLATKVAAVRALARGIDCTESELSSSILRDLRPHEVLIDAEEQSRDLVLLVSGELQEMSEFGGADGTGTWFGQAAKPGSLHNVPCVLSNEPAPTSLVATVASTVLVIPGSAMTRLLETSSGVAVRLARIFLEGLSPVYRLLSYSIQPVQLQVMRIKTALVSCVCCSCLPLATAHRETNLTPTLTHKPAHIVVNTRDSLGKRWPIKMTPHTHTRTLARHPAHTPRAVRARAVQPG